MGEKNGSGGAIVLLLVPVLVIGGIFGIFLILMGGGSSAAAACGGGTASTVDVSKVPSGPIAGFDHDQLVVAAGIMNAAKQLGLNARAQQLGVMTAMGESSLQSLTYGDNAINPDGSIADSIGPFQQQSSWGTTEERLDPFTSATKFYERLPGVANWESIEPTLAAHAVQGNADPYFYTTYWDGAGQITAALNGDTSQEGAAAAPASGGCADGPVGFPLTKPFNMSDNYGPRPGRVAGASTYHPADDLSGACGTPVYAIAPGTVTLSDRLTLSVKSPEGYIVSYLHSHVTDRAVAVGDQVAIGQQITAIGNEAPSTGCHLDIRVSAFGTTNADVAALANDSLAPNWVDPEQFYALFGQTLCDDTCSRNYDE
ncbi:MULTISPECIES: M23 family metallopeptidase [unclassified Cryobacterium]|uniref:M23 family metallopeptidase n=1 Tax=unclassified Cryobacterium TaxID=2649013 RepID=UPI001F0C13A8|nr:MULTISPECIES: M23 family metallopeptidase [unclassified Cryobacterium]